MSLKKCLICGSSNLRADRSLSGRLVCTSCGNLYGKRRKSSSGYYRNKISFLNKKNLIIFLFFLAFVFIII